MLVQLLRLIYAMNQALSCAMVSNGKEAAWILEQAMHCGHTMHVLVQGGATGAAAPNTTESQDFDYWI